MLSPSKSPRFTRAVRVALAVVLLAFIAGLNSSCSLLRLRGEVKQINATGVVSVQLSNLSPTATNYAVALTLDGHGSNVMAGFQAIGPDGFGFFLLRLKQTYAMGAFADLNGDGVYDGGEPVALVTNVHPAALSDTGERGKLVELKLDPTKGLPRGQRFVLPRTDVELGDALPVALGKIADLDDPKFSVASGEAGMWQPFDFIQRHGFGVYFMEPYTPKKTPVLFVYGISGSPQDWRVMLEKIDRKKYQPWFFFYPSGLRLDKSANALAGAMLLLKTEHRFERLNVVAHSMGGLVSRGAIQRVAATAGTNFVSHFISISTPWAGHEAAEMGVKHLKFPVPSWRDMVPRSDYLTSIHSQPLPAGTRYDLIFSYKSAGGMGLPDDNDGVVGVASELLPSVQESASSVLGLNHDHMGILNSPAALKRVEKVLAE